VQKLTHIFFDAFGTAFDTRDVPRDEIIAYLTRCVLRPWYRQRHPASWAKIPAFADTAEGVRRLRTKYTVVLFSNGDLDTLLSMSKNAGIEWSGYVDLAAIQAYKPDPSAYWWACTDAGAKREESMMVTANKRFADYKFGDLEIAAGCGMQTRLIRGDSDFKTIIDLAHHLGC
jgi:FMN phosphatase YigB (HAD superfamily)